MSDTVRPPGFSGFPPPQPDYFPPWADAPLAPPSRPSSESVEADEIPEFTRPANTSAAAQAAMGGPPPPTGQAPVPQEPEPLPVEQAGQGNDATSGGQAGVEDAVATAANEAAIAKPQGPEASDGADRVALEALAKERVGFHFVRATHVPGNADSTAADLAASGCKTVAFELTGVSPDARKTLEAAMNVSHDQGMPESSRAMAGRLLELRGLTYYRDVIARLPPTVERIRTFDIGTDHPAHQKQLLTSEAERRLERTIVSYQPNADQQQALSETAGALADESIEREPEMARQLIELAIEEANLEPHGIAAVTGAVHDGPYEMVSAEGFNCTASPPVFFAGNPGSPVLVSHIVRQLIHDRTTPIESEQLERAHLEVVARYHLLGGTECLELARDMPADQLAELRQAIESAKEPRRPLDDVFEDTRQILLRAADRFFKNQA